MLTTCVGNKDELTRNYLVVGSFWEKRSFSDSVAVGEYLSFDKASETNVSAAIYESFLLFIDYMH